MRILKTLLVVSSLAVLALAGSAFAADKDAKLKPYTLEKCIVSDEKLGEMGKPVVYEYKDREIKFCCKNCIKDFKKDPAAYVKKIEAAEAAAKAKK